MSSHTSSDEPFAWYPKNPDCVKYNYRGTPYEEITCALPQLKYIVMPWEYNYAEMGGRVNEFMHSSPWVPVLACTLYGLWCYYGQKYFKNREPWDMRGALALWNFLLSAFSLFGLCRTLPTLIFNLVNYRFIENVCMLPESQYGSGSEGIWAQFFVLSKFPELFDTFFIVVHKKPLIFLHWYHHITVLLFCWHSYVTQSSFGPFFICMNYAVHAVMYGYYFLMAIKAKPKWFNPLWITIAQILQMAMGVSLTSIGWYVMLVMKPEGCRLNPANNFAGLIMYGSYLFLFLEFFGERYSFKEVKKFTTLKKTE